ncbi:SDR family NAD(P)-dependent oxidoreductase [Noviherbaspirillum sedimenti]|uniref:SDR family oxidoreductase n=1 Tax=Noviherbaspirillum sedimenti TaxID=2320865 RepID=A0A3A3FXT5_9BURK|nr:SDR family NAD(P)-dependent oxidoreductase [Noviherbaspirillum sedimenti]RJG00431.1 SDR family oxidoreductase [Noviherbaspirillum sedimenti]
MKLIGKVAVITGASRGIGRGIAETYAREGASVVLADINESAAQDAAGAIAAAYGNPTLALKADVASVADNQTLIEQAIQRFGHVDLLVCNAGIVRPARPIEDISPEQWREVIDINLMGCIYATQFFVPAAKARQQGRIIYMASVAGEVGGVSSEISYSVSKAAVLCLTKAVAKQLGPYGITVNAIAPGAIQTAMTDILQYPPGLKQSIPLQRYGDVDDIAAAALYLASDDAKYVTGTTMDVNGGMFMK